MGGMQAELCVMLHSDFMGKLPTLWAEILYGQLLGKAKTRGLAQNVDEKALLVTMLLYFLGKQPFCP